ncbi:hypothetical protein ABPG72_008997 [Tetrahymena utriculariae]
MNQYQNNQGYVNNEWIQITENLFIYTLKPLGQGGFGTVYKGCYTNNLEVAVKQLKQYVDNSGTLNEYFQQEIETCKLIMEIKNEFIVQVVEIVQQYNNTYVVMDLCVSDLSKLRKEIPEQRLDPMTTLTFLKQIALGIKSLHDLNLAHRDIKPDNIFIAKNQNGQQYCKVGDFGLGKSSEILKTKVGTISYMAPDMLDLNNLQYSSKVDIWAIGVMAHELLTGTLLFQGQTPDIIRNNILRSRNYKDWYKVATSGYQNDYISQSFKYIQSESIVNLIDMMLQKSPKDRKDINQIITSIDECIAQLNSNNYIIMSNNNNNNNIYFNSQLNNQQQQYAQSQPNNNQRQLPNQQDQNQQSDKKVKELEDLMNGQKKMFEDIKNKKDNEIATMSNKMQLLERFQSLYKQLIELKDKATKHFLQKKEEKTQSK